MIAPAPGPKDAPDVVVHPPILFAVVLVLGAVLHRLWPLWPPHNWPWREQWPGGDIVVLNIVGWGVLALGLFYAGAAMIRFHRAGTNIPTFRPATALVTGGIYRFTRNPMYVGMILAQTALALLLRDLWFLILLAPLIAVLRYGVVAREEVYMERKFGAAYRAYTTRVRRRF